MNLLALETSTEYCSVAVWQNGIVAERAELAGQKHSEMLMEMVDEVLRRASMSVSQIDGIAFGKGPGSFTGVRIACGVAQGLALGLDVPVVGVCTLEALAEAAGKDKVIAALDARMGELYLAAYQKRGEGWEEVVAPCLCRADTAPLLTGHDWFGAGSGFAVAGKLLQPYYGLQAMDAAAVPQASAVATLAAAVFAQGKAVDAAQALPLYLRDKVALTTRERTEAK